MIHFVYKTTNVINGCFYIGVHSTENLYDGYLGSGLLLKRSINKYGKDSFIREILKTFETREEANKYEVEILTEDVLKSNECYNIAPGGQGGKLTEHPWNKGVFGYKGTPHTEEMKQKLSQWNVGRPSTLKGKPMPKQQRENIAKAKLGKQMSKETKLKISETLKKRYA